MTPRVWCALVQALVWLALATTASRSEAAEFTNWMARSAYDTLSEQKRRDGFYPLEVEARVTPDRMLYRARFEPFPAAPFAYYSYPGMGARAFATRNRDLESEGYRLVWVQSIADNKGAPHFQATWVKGNGPVGFAPLAQETESPPRPSASQPAPSTPPASDPPAGAVSRGEFTFKVTYRVKGTAASAMLTFRDPKEGTVQRSVHLPWQLSFDTSGGAFLYVSAQNEGVNGSVMCEIEMDGESRTVSTSTGAYVIAECSNMAERR